MGSYKLCVDEDFPKTFDYLNKALKIGEELNDILSIVIANIWMGGSLTLNCEFTKALHYWKKALEINVAVNVLWGISAIKTWMAIVNVFQGKIKNGYETSGEASRIANESGDVYSKSHSYTALGWSAYCKGYLKDAEKHLLKVTEIPEIINHLMFNIWAHFLLGKVYFDTREYEISKKHYERAISLSRHGSLWPSWVNYYKTLLALSKVMNNEKDINLNEIFKWHEDIKAKSVEGVVLNCIGTILLNINDQQISEAEDWIKRAIETNQKYGMMWNLARDYALYAEWFKQKGDLPKASENLNKAIEIFKECGADGWVDKYKKELAEL